VQRDLWHFEDRLAESGYTVVGGIDEAGRGPLAGPVVAACAIVPRYFDVSGIDDSKKLTPTQRDRCYDRLVESGVVFSIGVVEADEIDKINILRATHVAMRRSAESIAEVPHALLIDGLPVPNLLNCLHQPIVGGDHLSISIAVASIVAKVTRDRLMCEYGARFPEYGFEKHKGYGTALHLKALRDHGPCPIHRRSFAPIAELLLPVLL